LRPWCRVVPGVLFSAGFGDSCRTDGIIGAIGRISSV
jgi:hypothetical protein